MKINEIPDNKIFYDENCGISILHMKANNTLFKRYGDTWILIDKVDEDYNGYVYMKDLGREWCD